MEQDPIKGIQKAVAILIVSGLMIIIAIISYFNTKPVDTPVILPSEPVSIPIEEQTPALENELLPKSTDQETIEPDIAKPEETIPNPFVPKAEEESTPKPPKIEKKDFNPSNDESIVF